MSKTPLKDKFLLRSEPRYGESREGYMWRLCTENGHELPLEIRVVLGRLKNIGYDDPEAATHELIGERLDNELRQKEARAFSSIKGAALSQWMKKSPYPKFCPLCIEQTQTHQFLWNLPLVDVCPIHGRLLLEHCSACSKRLSWRYQSTNLACVCGVPIASMDARPARLWQYVLSKMIAGASDLESDVSFENTYSLREVYMALNWAWSFRHLLTRPYIYPSQGWLVTQKKRMRKEPRAWEVVLLLQSAEDLWARFHTLLQYQFTHSTDVLVQVRADALLRLSLDCIDDLEMKRNPLGRSAVAALRGCLGELSAKVETMPDLCFHPWSDSEQRETWLAQLNELVLRIVKVGKESRQGAAIGLGGGMTTMPGTWSYHPNDIAVMIVNRLFGIAIAGYNDDDVGIFAVRWPLPGKLEKSQNLLSDLAGHFRGIRPGEQVYVLSLVELVLERVQSRQGIKA